jgi:hypothetical protein
MSLEHAPETLYAACGLEFTLSVASPLFVDNPVSIEELAFVVASPKVCVDFSPL